MLEQRRELLLWAALGGKLNNFVLDAREEPAAEVSGVVI